MFNVFSIYKEHHLVDSNDLIGKLVIGTTRNIEDNKLSSYLNDYLLNHKIDVLIDYIPNIHFTEKDNIEANYIDKFNTNFACSKDFYVKYGDKIKTVNFRNKVSI